MEKGLLSTFCGCWCLLLSATHAMFILVVYVYLHIHYIHVQVYVYLLYLLSCCFFFFSWSLFYVLSLVINKLSIWIRLLYNHVINNGITCTNLAFNFIPLSLSECCPFWKSSCFRFPANSDFPCFSLLPESDGCVE